jgi:hypothetical protein
MKRRKLFLDQTQSPRDKMQFPMTNSQATILSRLITGIRLRSSEMGWADMVILTQVRAIKMTKEGLAITDAGKRRFIKFVKTNPNIVNLETKKL